MRKAVLFLENIAVFVGTIVLTLAAIYVGCIVATYILAILNPEKF